MADELGIFEAMFTQRAIRRLRPDPLPDGVITKILEAAIHAPSGGNRQGWAFMVITDPGLKSKVAELYRSAYSPFAGPQTTPAAQRIAAGSAYLNEHMQEAPALLLVCSYRGVYSDDWNMAASIYPAVQNVLLAARALGVGSLLTTRARLFQPQLRELLGMPENAEVAALLPLGYPGEGERYGPTTRKSLSEVAFRDHWGHSWGS